MLAESLNRRPPNQEAIVQVLKMASAVASLSAEQFDQINVNVIRAATAAVDTLDLCVTDSLTLEAIIAAKAAANCAIASTLAKRDIANSADAAAALGYAMEALDVGARAVSAVATEQTNPSIIKEYRSTVWSDYKKLLELDLGSYPDVGNPLLPSENGPLGELWTDGAYRRAPLLAMPSAAGWRSGVHFTLPFTLDSYPGPHYFPDHTFVMFDVVIKDKIAAEYDLNFGKNAIPITLDTQGKSVRTYLIIMALPLLHKHIPILSTLFQ
jgi:hypothetical protein